jgi:hypothetical protein
MIGFEPLNEFDCTSYAGVFHFVGSGGNHDSWTSVPAGFRSDNRLSARHHAQFLIRYVESIDMI